MDFWDGSTSPSVLKDNSDSSAEYERNFATPRVRRFGYATILQILNFLTFRTL